MSIDILIVDDSAMMRKVIEKTINICDLDDVSVYEAGNGVEGIDILEGRSIDLMLMDISMPIMDGIAMLKKVKAQADTEALPIIVVSNESNEQRIKKIKHQVTKFVHKPFTPEELAEGILELVDKAYDSNGTG